MNVSRNLKRQLLFAYKFLLRGYKASSESYTKHLRKKGVKIGEKCCFHDPASNFIDTDKPYMITIGNNVQITRGVTIVAHGYDWIVLQNKYGGKYGSAGKVSIGNNVFIGMNTIILKGAVIHDNVIIGAGSLVNSTIESNCIVGGIPAKKLMSLEDYNHKRKSAILAEAVDAYKAAVERNVFESIKENWEFSWIYDVNCNERYFNSFAEFNDFCQIK